MSKKKKGSTSQSKTGPDDRLCQALSFPIVGIGASAGALDAYKSFFSVMPADSGMAFVLVQHLDPHHESLTADLLAHYTSMPVSEITDKMRIKVDHIYVIPPNKYVTVIDNELHLTEPVLRRGMRMPIDHFLRSLAEVHQDRAIGIILTGTGADGALGVESIKAAGGVVLVQSPETAQYDGMPRSALATGQVDNAAPIEALPDVLIQTVRNAISNRGQQPIDRSEERDASLLRTILAHLKARTKYDFSCYKKGTLRRRIARRMGLRRVETLDHYLDLIRKDPEESQQLCKDLMIGVTGFFREAEAFEALEKVIAKIVADKKDESPIRIWVPGCATGEESFSVAILATEQLRLANKNCQLQLFATDINEDALDIARAGLYPEDAVANIAPERLDKFFQKLDGDYQVHKKLRDATVFAVQNLITDPPFSNLDLVCCRNLLIYLEPDIQRKVIALFHFALSDGGHLLLGSAETVGQRDDLFVVVSKKWRIYRRIGAMRRKQIDFPIVTGEQKTGKLPYRALPLAGTVRLDELVNRLLLENFAPASVLVDHKRQIVFYSGPINRFLDQPTGAPTDDLLTKTRGELRPKIRALIQKIKHNRSKRETGTVRLDVDGELRRVKITVIQANIEPDITGFYLVSFQYEPEPRPLSSAGEDMTGSKDAAIQLLEKELQATRVDLQRTVEEMESANEELKAANEEIMSVNEELQSTNEELETSKEELQSLNEELSTVNSQLEEKVRELEQVNDDLSNILISTDIATIFLDTEYRIKRFTPATKRLFHLIDTDVGRPFSDISWVSTDAELLRDAKTVLETLIPIETEIETDDARWYSRRVLPYRTDDNRIDGVVFTFVDITERKRLELDTHRARSFAEAVVATVREPLMVLDQNLNVVRANTSFYDVFKTDRADTEGVAVYELGDGQWDVPALRKLLEDIIPSNESFDDFEIEHDFPTIGHKRLLLNARKVIADPGESPLILLAIEDVTRRESAEYVLRKERDRAQQYLDVAGVMIVALAADQTVSLINQRGCEVLGYEEDDIVGKNWFDNFLPPDQRDYVKPVFARILSGEIKQDKYVENPVLTRSGEQRLIAWHNTMLFDDTGNILGSLSSGEDITEQKQAEQELRTAKDDAEKANEAKTRFLAAASHDLRQPLAALQMLNSFLSSTISDSKLLEVVGNQKRALASITELLDTYLNLSRLEAGAITPEISEFPVNDLLARIRNEFKQQAQEKGLSLRVVPCTLVTRSDWALLDRILENLVSNAVKYTDCGKVLIGCRRQNDTFRFEVWDTGPGISNTELDAIFEEFTQLDNPAREKSKGLGLGLSIASQLARLLDHRLTVRSVSERGSVFSVEVPRVKTASPLSSVIEKMAPSVVMNLNDLSVFLIEDNPDVRDAMTLFLESLGARVIVATTGIEAMALLDTPDRQIDLIIADYRLPGKNGIEVIGEIQHIAGRRIPAILVTGDTSAEAVQELESSGHPVLYKPVNSDELAQVVSQVVSG